MGSFRINLVQSQADEITVAVDGGAGAGRLKIYDENAAGVPADVSVALTTQLELVDIPLNDPSFAAAVDASPNARIDLDVTPEPEANATANATSTPTLFARVEDSNGVEHVQFDTVGVGSGELQINSLAISTGAAVKVTGGSFTVSESWS